MKKFIIIMLIAVVAMGSVFAADEHHLGLSVGYGGNIAAVSADNGFKGVGNNSLMITATGDIGWYTDATAKNLTLGLLANATMGIPTTAFELLGSSQGAGFAFTSKVPSCSLQADLAFNVKLKLDSVFALSGGLGPSYLLNDLTVSGLSSFGATAYLQGNFNISEAFAINLNLQGGWYPACLSTSAEMRDNKVQTFTSKIALGGTYKF